MPPAPATRTGGGRSRVPCAALVVTLLSYRPQHDPVAHIREFRNAHRLENSRPNLDLVVRLDLVFELDRQVDRLAVDDAVHAEAAIGPAVRQTAGEDDRLRHGGAGVEDVVAGILHEPGNVEALRLRHVDDVTVLQHD